MDSAPSSSQFLSPTPRLVIVGGSYVGLEFAQIFRTFGSLVGSAVRRTGRNFFPEGMAAPPPE